MQQVRKNQPDHGDLPRRVRTLGAQYERTETESGLQDAKANAVMDKGGIQHHEADPALVAKVQEEAGKLKAQWKEDAAKLGVDGDAVLQALEEELRKEAKERLRKQTEQTEEEERDGEEEPASFRRPE